MGRGLADIAGRDKLPYDFVDAPGHGAAAHRGRREVAGRGLGRDPGDPALPRRRHLRRRPLRRRRSPCRPTSTTRSARPPRTPPQLAGLNVLRLINEPTAAAIAYGLDNAQRRPLRRLRPGRRHLRHLAPAPDAGVFEVVATGGDSALGGDDYRCRAGRLGARRKPASAPTAPQRQARRCWWPRAPPRRRCRRRRTRRSPARSPAGELSLARRRAQQFEAIARPLVDAHHRRRAQGRCATRRSTRPTIEGVVMVGGSTRMPLVRRRSASSSAARR